jgi:hypothetical protein
VDEEAALLGAGMTLGAQRQEASQDPWATQWPKGIQRADEPAGGQEQETLQLEQGAPESWSYSAEQQCLVLPTYA